MSQTAALRRRQRDAHHVDRFGDVVPVFVEYGLAPSSTRLVEAGPDGLTFLAIGAPVGSRRGRPML